MCEILTEVGDRDYNQICYGRGVIEGWDCTVDRDSAICKDPSEWEYHWCIAGMYNRLSSERHIACSPHYEHFSFTTLYHFHLTEYYDLGMSSGSEREEVHARIWWGNFKERKESVGRAWTRLNWLSQCDELFFLTWIINYRPKKIHS